VFTGAVPEADGPGSALFPVVKQVEMDRLGRAGSRLLETCANNALQYDAEAKPSLRFPSYLNPPTAISPQRSHPPTVSPSVLTLCPRDYNSIVIAQVRHVTTNRILIPPFGDFRHHH
jgi:hypothetical protein